MREFIKKSSLKSEAFKEFCFGSLYNIPVYSLHPFTRDINFKLVLQKIESLVPKPLTDNFEGIYIGQFDEFEKENKNFNALYKDDIIYVSNNQDNESDLVDDIIHEIAHSLEKKYHNEIYGDDKLESEFLAKRKMLYFLVDKAPINMVYYMNPEYQTDFDDFLYKVLGYDYLRNVSSGLFYSPYAITYLREYWANGFENYLLGDKQRLKDLSPVLYKKIEQLFEDNEEYYNEFWHRRNQKH